MFRIAPILFLLATAACSGSTENDMAVEPITIESVDVLILESFPPQATARVKGVIGDGCSELHSEVQRRTGDTVTITVLRQRPREAICTQIAKLYDQTIRLEGTFPPGRYTLRVNSVEKTFTTQ
jgi:hypothetical protein